MKERADHAKAAEGVTAFLSGGEGANKKIGEGRGVVCSRVYCTRGTNDYNFGMEFVGNRARM